MAFVARKVRTRYVIGSGKKIKFVPKGTSGARHLKERSRDFYGFWLNDGGQKQSVRFKNCREKAAAQVALNDHLKRLNLHKAGLAPHPKDQAVWEQTPIEIHLQAYLTQLRVNERSERYVSEVERQATAVFKGVGAKVMADLTADKVTTWLGGLKHGADASRAPSARTRDTYRQAVCFFTAWLADPRREQAHRIRARSFSLGGKDYGRNRPLASVSQRQRSPEAPGRGAGKAVGQLHARYERSKEDRRRRRER